MVNIDSGVDYPAGITAVQEFMAANLEYLGFKTHRLRIDAISHFKSRLAGGNARRAGLLAGTIAA